jgi:hypothetical protein
MNEQKVRRRFETHGSGAPLVLPPDHLAMREQRTLFPNTVRSANPDELVLKSGIHSTKLGDKIVKGVWKEALIFSLTLEERKTCPITCQQLPLCMGNGMHLATRWKVDSELYVRLMTELEHLAYVHRTYAVRLHVLGDFVNTRYVQFWLDALRAYPGLRIFGFTHWERTSEIGAMIEAESVRWDRFRIRFSDNHTGPRTAHVIRDRAAQGKHPLGIICPADDTRPERNCGNCAFCINSTAPVVFKEHGPVRSPRPRRERLDQGRVLLLRRANVDLTPTRSSGSGPSSGGNPTWTGRW